MNQEDKDELKKLLIDFISQEDELGFELILQLKEIGFIDRLCEFMYAYSDGLEDEWMKTVSNKIDYEIH